MRQLGAGQGSDPPIGHTCFAVCLPIRAAQAGKVAMREFVQRSKVHRRRVRAVRRVSAAPLLIAGSAFYSRSCIALGRNSQSALVHRKLLKTLSSAHAEAERPGATFHAESCTKSSGRYLIDRARSTKRPTSKNLHLQLSRRFGKLATVYRAVLQR